MTRIEKMLCGLQTAQRMANASDAKPPLKIHTAPDGSVLVETCGLPSIKGRGGCLPDALAAALTDARKAAVEAHARAAQVAETERKALVAIDAALAAKDD